MNTQFFKRYLDSGAPGGGSGPTLSDLDNPDYKPPVALDAAAQAQADEEAARIAQETADNAAYEALVLEAKNEDGTLKEGYEEVDGKITKVEPANPIDDNADDSPESFFADVNKLHGTEIKVEYPEGVDPLTPEGIYHRDKVIADNAIQGFEGYLKQSDPRAYAYMLHRQAGGDDDTFFSQKTFSLPEYSTFKESTEAQVRLLKSSLASKGLDEDTVQLAVDKAIKDGALFTKADAAYRDIESHQDRELAEIEKIQAAREQEYLSSVNSFNQLITTTITEGKGMKFIIPDTDKPNFLQFVKEHVEYDSNEGKFLLVQKVGENITQQLEAMYLLYKKGDLTGLIKNQAQTQVVRRLKTAIDKSKQQKLNTGEDTSGASKNVPLGTL